MSGKSIPAWLEEAVFYQVYPQSFYDSNGDGIGDIPGIQLKLDYLETLGVNAVWINPCFDSPFLDAGYDVRDYYRVAPRYGTNDDLRALFAEAARRGIRILLDLVPGHTSIEHPWFQASCRHARNEYSDWFIWTDSVWAWMVPGLRAISGYAERDGCFVTNFFYHQPALNYGFAAPDPAHPWQQPVDAPGPQRVREELRRIMRFWLEMGASGFRVDMAGWLVKGDPDSRENIRLWQEMRAWLDREFPEACLVSEWFEPALAIQAGFHVDFCPTLANAALFRRPDLRGLGANPYAYSFFNPVGTGNIREFVDHYLRHYTQIKGRGHIALLSGNHDLTPRLSTGLGVEDLKLAFLFLLTMPGPPFIYYGDEIGMRTVEGLPSKEGGYQRTGVRTPMQWDRSPNAGFSTAPAERLYLPVDDRPDRPTVADQLDDPDSLLSCVRHLIALRRAHPALCASGEWSPVFAEAGRYPFVYRRSGGDENLLVAINPADRPVEVDLGQVAIQGPGQTLYGVEGAIVERQGRWVLRLPPVSGGVYRA